MTQAGRIVLRSSPSEDTSPEMGLILGRALAMDYHTVVVAKDRMKSSTMMKDALVAGLLSAGCDVIDIGCTSAPVAALAASRGDCAVYVAEFREIGLISGYILLNRNGSLFRRDQIRHLEKVFTDPPELPDYRHLGTARPYRYATEDYNRRLLDVLPKKVGGSIILDCGCGTAADSAPQVLNALMSDVITINAQRDMDYIPDTDDHGESESKDLRMLIGSEPGCIGISINKTGTILALLDEKGRRVSDEHLAAMIVMFLKPKKVVVPYTMTSLIEDAFHGIVDLEFVTPFESAPEEERKFIRSDESGGAVCEMVGNEGADIGFYDGGIIFGNISMMSDGIYASAVITQMSVDNSLNRTVDSLPEYHRDEHTYEYECSRDEFTRMMDEEISSLGSDRITRMDSGWRVEMDSGWIAIVLRGDGVAEVIAESLDKAYLVGLAEIAGDLVEKCAMGQ